MSALLPTTLDLLHSLRPRTTPMRLRFPGDATHHQKLAMQVWAGGLAGPSQSGRSTHAHFSATSSEEASGFKGSSSSGPESSSSGGQGSSGNRLVDIARSDPILAQKLEIPGVMQALNEVGLQNWFQRKEKLCVEGMQAIMHRCTSNERNCVWRTHAIIHCQAAG